MPAGLANAIAWAAFGTERKVAVGMTRARGTVVGMTAHISGA
jgi:hypothetical protein